MDSLNQEQRRRNMQAIKATGTSTENMLAKALWLKGYRYRKNDKLILGKPDISFKKLKIAIFVDGEFWHGKDWDIKKSKITQNKDYWIKKIERNIERDALIMKTLKADGWIAVRYWHRQIKKNLQECVEEIEKVISLKRHSE